MASVEHPVSHAIPEFDHRTEECRHVSPAMTGEESRYVFEEDGSRSVNSGKFQEGEGEAGPGSGEACPLAGDAEVLARKTAGPENGSLPRLAPKNTAGCWPTPRPVAWSVNRTCLFPCCHSNDVTEVRDSGPSLGKDGAGVGVDLGEADGPPSGTFKAKVKSSDP